MSRPKLWAWFSAFALLVVAVLSLASPQSVLLSGSDDLFSFVLTSTAAAVLAINAVRAREQQRVFWGLMALGAALWAVNGAYWSYYELLLRRPIPEQTWCDAVLFLHLVPYIAAVALRPDRAGERRGSHSSLNFLMLLVWWVFLYAFLVIPVQYVKLDGGAYDRNFTALYLVENLVFVVMLGALCFRSQGEWRKIYRNLFIANALYTFSSFAINLAIAHSEYFSGSLYDVPFLASICWLVWIALMAPPSQTLNTPRSDPRNTRALATNLAMLAILSMPLIAFWAMFEDRSPQPVRHFRFLITLGAMMVLGAFLFVRQYLLDRDLIRLLGESRSNLENLQRLQNQLVQREKLASLGQLVAGAAHEINNPLAAILGYSELLAADPALNPPQSSMAEKIGQQARRTRDLVLGLLSFAQQAHAQKSWVDLESVLHRALRLEAARCDRLKIKTLVHIEPYLPKVWGDVNQILQCCGEIIANGIDAVEGTQDGTLSIRAFHQDEEVVVTFVDNGRGVENPQRVFDPFYTTKPIGKGTGLGLSATYGIMQEHEGVITCQNSIDGGAVFTLRFPLSDPDRKTEPRAVSA